MMTEQEIIKFAAEPSVGYKKANHDSRLEMVALGLSCGRFGCY